MASVDDFPPTLFLGAPPTHTPRDLFQPPSAPPPPERLLFTGTGGEYFRIWIVNLLFTLITFGIYSAWAKVRRLRYFYDSTELAGSRFEYHGEPVAILKGRLIAIGILAAYHFAPKISVFAGLAVMVGVGLIMPWLIWKSLQFKLYNSSYRGIRFGFGGTLGQAYKTYLLLPILSAFTFNLLAPFVHQRIKKFQHDESRFGTSQFSFHGNVSGFYGAYFVALIVFLVGMVWMIPVFKLMMQVMFATGGGRTVKSSVFLLGILAMMAVFAWGYLVYSVFMTMLQNLVWNNTRLEDHTFQSDMQWTRVVFIAITNAIGIALTLGLYTPFAKIRMLKYRVESVTMIPAADLDSVVADTEAAVSATGEGVTDMLDFDFAL